MPVSSAARPLALEIISGLTPGAPAGALSRHAASARRAAASVPAARLLAERKRRRDTRDITIPSDAAPSGGDRIYHAVGSRLIYNPGFRVPATRPVEDVMHFRSKWEALPTEAINSATLAIDKLAADDIVELMINEDRKVVAAVQREKDRIALGADMIATALRGGGRVVFVGAGTSGRLGVLESAEMPPTFGTSQTLVQAVMAGGRGATFRAREGVEDNYEEGVRAISRFRPTRRDVVVGVSASGMTQFVRGALTRARKAGSTIMFVTCDPKTELQTFVDLTIAPAVGPEVIAGSTRLKAGTATKMVLNMLTTVAMVRIGKTYGNLMVDVAATNEKLRARARRIVLQATGAPAKEVDAALAAADGSAKVAIVSLLAGVDAEAARARLGRAHGSIREAVQA
jgi:N-acetylmuramic acid 6-phosphate etherase